MSDVEKQEGQKTVVAFITGLLIGGLLVWVFSSSPTEAPTVEKDDKTTTEETAGNNDDTSKEASKETETTTKSNTEPIVIKAPETNGTGALTVTNQKAGDSVAVTVGSYPTTKGWVAVHDHVNGVTGKVLGAARYDTEAGLLPTNIGLLRATVAQSEYKVVFHSDNGDKNFASKDDVELTTAASAVFKAE